MSSSRQLHRVRKPLRHDRAFRSVDLRHRLAIPRRGDTGHWPPERWLARLRTAAGLPDLEADILGVFPWDFGAAVARRQRLDRVIPVRGRSASYDTTGRPDEHRDCRWAQLGWKLAWVIRGWAGELLLTPTTERAPVGRANAEASMPPQWRPRSTPGAGLRRPLRLVAIGGGRLAGPARRTLGGWQERRISTTTCSPIG